MRALLASLADLRGALEAAKAPAFKLEDVTLEAPIDDPQKFLAIGMNYQAHAAEAVAAGLAVPTSQLWFNKQVSCNDRRTGGKFDPICEDLMAQLALTPTGPEDFSTQATLPFADAVRARRSCRDFLPGPVPDALIEAVLEDAQWAPSNCNTQPWNIHLVSGAKRHELARAIQAADAAGHYTPDFTWDEAAFGGRYAERRRAHGAVYYCNLDIARDDAKGRRKAGANNYTFYNAPHVALLFMPVFGDNVRTAGDIGMYGQTFFLSRAARGIGGIPQTVLGLFADTIRETLGLSTDLKLLFGISFGYQNAMSPANRKRVGRNPWPGCVTFHT